jgi:hypothetical protein
MIMESTNGGYMWMKILVTLSREWNTREFRQVTMALAIGPVRESGGCQPARLRVGMARKENAPMVRQ